MGRSFHPLHTLLGTYISPFKGMFKDDFPLPKEGYGCFQKIVGFPPKSSILVRLSNINHPFRGFSPYFLWNTHMLVSCQGTLNKLEKHPPFEPTKPVETIWSSLVVPPRRWRRDVFFVVAQIRVDKDVHGSWNLSVTWNYNRCIIEPGFFAEHCIIL